MEFQWVLWKFCWKLEPFFQMVWSCSPKWLQTSDFFEICFVLKIHEHLAFCFLIFLHLVNKQCPKLVLGGRIDNLLIKHFQFFQHSSLDNVSSPLSSFSQYCKKLSSVVPELSSPSIISTKMYWMSDGQNMRQKLEMLAFINFTFETDIGSVKVNVLNWCIFRNKVKLNLYLKTI